MVVGAHNPWHHPFAVHIAHVRLGIFGRQPLPHLFDQRPFNGDIDTVLYAGRLELHAGCIG